MRFLDFKLLPLYGHHRTACHPILEAGHSNNALTGLTTIANNGALVLQDGAVVATSTALKNSGSIYIDPGGNTGTSSMLTIGGDLTNSGSISVSGSYNAPDGLNAVALTNDGTVFVAFGKLTVDNLYIQASGTTTVNGSLQAATLDIEGGSLEAQAGGIGVGGTASGIPGSLIVAPSGLLTDNAGINLGRGGEPGTLINAGTVKIGNDGILSMSSGGAYLQTGGTTDVNGTLMSPNVNIDGGTLSGTGKIQGTVTVASGAALSPGDPGTVDIFGPLDLAGTLNETIDSGSSFDVTDVSGQLTLDSSSVLDILLASGFDPSVGTSFAIMDVGSLAPGLTFGSIQNQMFNGGTEQWDIAYNSTDIVLTAVTVTSSSSTPEPASFLLLGTGLLGLAWVARRKRARGAAR